MKGQRNIRNKWLTVRVSEAEYKCIKVNFEKTTERKLSTYARKVLLGEPLVKEVRDASLQEVIVVLSRLQQDLNGLSNNFNQMVRKLHISDTQSQLKAWVEMYEKEKQLLFLQIETINVFIKKSAEKWLQ